MESTNRSSFENLSNWINGSISIKMLTIGFLTLLLLLPLSLIDDLIQERNTRKNEVVAEISQSWSSEQIIKGPILSIPYEVKSTYKDVNGKEQPSSFTYMMQVLPEQLDITGNIDHEFRKRGIYEVTLYESQLDLSGTFILPNFDIPNLNKVLWKEAFLTVGVSDMKGIQDEIHFELEDAPLTIESGSKIPKTIVSGFTSDNLGLSQSHLNNNIPFALNLNLRGSRQIQFAPLGKVTAVNVNSSWPDPSFKGQFLPTQHTINEQGFEAHWKVLHLNRNFPQIWTEEHTNYGNLIDESAFGVQLFNSTDDYQVISRASKYGIMTIAITFLVFFLVEVLGRKRIHPMQYILVGLALVLFYILLVSITEHSEFTSAYIIAAISTILMTFGYALTIFKDRKLAVGLLVVLVASYSFIFVTLQLVDYALLIGSLGLTVILALTMYLTRSIDWFRIGSARETGPVSDQLKTS